MIPVMSCNVVNPGCHKHLPFGDRAPPIMSQDCTTYLKNIDCCMSQFVTGKTMKECWSKLQVLLLYPSIFQQFLYRVSPVVRRLWWCSHQTLGPTLRSWVERVISETFCSLTAKFCSLSGFVGFFWCFFLLSKSEEILKPNAWCWRSSIGPPTGSIFVPKEWPVDSPGLGHLVGQYLLSCGSPWAKSKF